MNGTVKTCARCQKEFLCSSNAIEECACQTVSLSSATKDFLDTTYYGDCLCTDCLQSINQLVNYAEEHPLPRGGQSLQEGIHYYMEGNFFVFTELYHIQKGYCCHNLCRHCAYGYKK